MGEASITQRKVCLTDIGPSQDDCGKSLNLDTSLLHSPSLTVFFPPLRSPLCLLKASESPGRASAGPLVLAVTVAVPVCVLSLVAVLAACTHRRRRCARGRAKQPNMEEPLSECNLVNSGKTLKDLIYDMTTSGSGSGTWGCPAPAPARPMVLRCQASERVSLGLKPKANVAPCF